MEASAVKRSPSGSSAGSSASGLVSPTSFEKLAVKSLEKRGLKLEDLELEMPTHPITIADAKELLQKALCLVETKTSPNAITESSTYSSSEVHKSLHSHDASTKRYAIFIKTTSCQ
jgi:hypothetical protein